jgi:hypothetical protein
VVAASVQPLINLPQAEPEKTVIPVSAPPSIPIVNRGVGNLSTIDVSPADDLR